VQVVTGLVLGLSKGQNKISLRNLRNDCLGERRARAPAGLQRPRGPQSREKALAANPRPIASITIIVSMGPPLMPPIFSSKGSAVSPSAANLATPPDSSRPVLLISLAALEVTVAVSDQAIHAVFNKRCSSVRSKSMAGPTSRELIWR